MKWKIIGWTHYDDDNFKAQELTHAIKNVIIDEIQERDYFFTGYHHQEYDYCCPVLNNGNKVLLSQREMGDIMAKSHGYDGIYDYSLFTYPCDPSSEEYRLPNIATDESKIVDEKELTEAFDIALELEEYARADIDNILELSDCEKYRFIDRGDVINLMCGNHKSSYRVKETSINKDVTYSLEYNFKYRNIYDEVKRKEITDEYLQAPCKLLLKLEYIFNFNAKNND